MSLKTYIEELKSKKVAVIGVGISNRPLIRLLAESGVDVTAYDKRTSDKLGDVYNEFTALGVKFVLGDDYLDSLTGDVIFRTPGLHPDTPALVSARERGAVITSEMEAFFEICPCRMVAVTGSDGKTTTTSVIAELLRSAGFTVHVGGNIGNPLFCDADKMQPEDFAVLELSSFQLMTMKRSAEIAVVTNLGPNHLDIHHGMQEYVDAKKNVFLGQSGNGRVVLNLDNDYTRDFAPLAKGETVFFSRTSRSDNCVFCENGAIYDTVGGKTEKIMDTDEIFLPGVHNIENYMAAFAAVRGIVPH
ncbi:MAG: UDP-N-acetylmuramoyl-L-alanine--D-glutamate ligase, partial [Oscillospiraceae bacterium]|nr:UDP-N-acetylmuramoyl-L-alanine--D-glutamate ligase [Oscillospiraceae bacterium]